MLPPNFLGTPGLSEALGARVKALAAEAGVPGTEGALGPAPATKDIKGSEPLGGGKLPPRETGRSSLAGPLEGIPGMLGGSPAIPGGRPPGKRLPTPGCLDGPGNIISSINLLLLSEK